LPQDDDQSATEQPPLDQDISLPDAEAGTLDGNEHDYNSDEESERIRPQSSVTDQSDEEAGSNSGVPAQRPKRIVRRPARFC